MFGYIKPDNPYLYLKDETLYKALYCGICKSIGKTCGQRARFTLSYDLAFMNAIAHNVMGKDVVINKETCVAHPIKKRPVAEPDEISNMLACVNVILAYYKVKDDIFDEKKGGIKSSFITKGYKRAKARFPKIDGIVKSGYEKLLVLEKQNVDSIDIVSDCFAEMMKEISNEVFCEFATDSTNELFYALGKWVYLIDALDDYDKDIKKKNFNVFYNSYKNSDYVSLIAEHKEDICFIFNGIFSQIINNYKNVKTKYNTDLVVNILSRGIPAKTNQILKRGIVDVK